MTERTKVSGIQNNFFDSEQIDNEDMSLEQNYNNSAQSSLINNHIGSGVLPEILVQNTLFDSSDTSFSGVLFDGKAINVLSQPSDSNYGNQLEIEVRDSAVAGQRSIKIAIIGLNFQGELQYDTFVFKTNEKQFTKRHYTNILTVFFNDFKGISTKSFNLGGVITIKEADPLTLSRDTVMVAQDVEPNLFFRDFFVDGTTLNLLLATALPLYNVDSLGINIGFKENKILLKNDVSSQVGEKFLATTNNIQKVSLLLSVQNTDVGQAAVLNWQGDLIVSIYPLQSSIACSTDIVPNLAIEYSPTNIPLAQISLNYTTLQASGITLDGTPQPVEFVFSNTPVGAGTAIVSGSYYAVTVKRSGSASQCDILLATGSNHVENSRVTEFTGTTWVDTPEENLWFRIYTDAAKVSDGQAYETGHGIEVTKVALDPVTNTQIDYSLDKLQFVGNQLFTGVISAVLEKTDAVEDQRTGNPVFSRQQFVPSVQLLNPIDLNNLKAVADPLLVGLVSDKNLKSFDSTNSTISAKLEAWSFVKNQLVVKIISDQTDPKYSADVEALEANVVNGDLTNAKLVPDTTDPDSYYRISKAEIVTGIYGDINGDGLVDDRDLVLYNRLLGADLRTAPPTLTTITDGYNVTDGYTTTVENGYRTFTTFFVSESALSYKVINPANDTIVHAGLDGYIVVNPSDGSLANFNSASFNFNTVLNLTNMKIAVLASSNPGNIGLFNITGIDGYVPANPSHTLTIDKLYYTSDTLLQIMRADIDGDFTVSTNDGYYLQNYLLKAGSPFPPTSLPYSNIGTTFKAIRITVDPFQYNNLAAMPLVTNRSDDFYPGSNRALELHPVQDIFIGDGYTNFPTHDFTTPYTFSVIKQLSWEEYLVLARGHARLVPATFNSTTGHVDELEAMGVKYQVYPTSPNFDPGIVDTFVPNNLIIGNGGELKRPSGDFYKVDFEVGTVVLEIPDGLFAVERAINIFDDFIADYTGAGVTRLGFPAMRFADGTLVDTLALEAGQVRFSVSVQSFSPNTNGLDPDGLSGAIVDGKIGVSMDYATGILTLNFTNLYQDSVLATLNTKIQVNVFLKKGGFNNIPIFVDSFKTQNILNLISVFSGAGMAGGPISVVDLTSEVVGILPIANGGTGLGTVGPAGTFLVSDGYGLVYKSLQNPLFIPMFHGLGSAQSTSPSVLSAFTFRFDQIADGYTSIKLETIIESSDGIGTAQIKIFNVTTNSYIVLDTGSSLVLTTTNQTPTLKRSINLASILGSLSQDYIYELHLSLSPLSVTDYAYCKMARLAVLYA